MPTLPAKNIHMVHLKHWRFKCQGSPPHPSLKPVVSKVNSTQSRLANLEKLPSKPNTEQAKCTDASSSSSPSTNKKNRRTLLGGLDLTCIWPVTKAAAAEEISPNHLNRFQQLLLKTPEYSPRNNLGSRWREYQGSNDWAGLLDPLDENLRREVVRHGEFVQAAYNAFYSDQATALAQRDEALPQMSYRVTRSLCATSSVGLPGWLDNMERVLKRMTQQTSCIGYVAVCEDPREIRQMGRRDIVIALRGTSTLLEWVENFRPQLVQMPYLAAGNRARVGCGFLSLFNTRGTDAPSLAETVVEEVQRLLECYKGETLSITVTGHSLGAALSLLVADELSERVEHSPPITVFSFGGPRVGNRDFADHITAKNVKVLRIVNNQDVITKVPGIPIGHDEQGANNNNTSIAGAICEMLDRNNPLAYSHVGAELRVDTRMSPYLKPNADVACSHDLEAYLHLVDGFLASNCPFRADAKRSLTKLMNEQGSNVKLVCWDEVSSL